MGVALRIVRDRAAAEDVLHDAFMAIWNRASTIDPDRSEGRGWMCSSVRNGAPREQRGLLALRRRHRFCRGSEMAIAPTVGLFAPPARLQFMVVLVAPQGTAPGWVLQASSPQRLKLIPVAPEPVPAQRSLQFWTKADSWSALVSPGLVEPGKPIEIPLDKLPPPSSPTSCSRSRSSPATVPPPGGRPGRSSSSGGRFSREQGAPSSTWHARHAARRPGSCLTAGVVLHG